MKNRPIKDMHNVLIAASLPLPGGKKASPENVVADVAIILHPTQSSATQLNAMKRFAINIMNRYQFQ